MDAMPLQDLDPVGHGDPDPHPTPRSTFKITATDEPRKSSGGAEAAPAHGSSIFSPLSDEDASQLPELNFRPLALQLGYLVPLLIWYCLCFAGLVTLVVFDRKSPTLLHLRLGYSYNLWAYVPGIVGFLTTTLWRGTLQSYNRIIPYVRMANLPISQDGKISYATAKAADFLTQPLNAIPGGEVSFVVVWSLYVSGDYLSCIVNVSPIFVTFLTPVKAGLIQLVEDDSGWGIRISMVFAVAAMVIYVWLFSVTLAITLYLRKSRTGLRWNPSTLAAQLSLIQGSNILHEFANIPTGGWAPLNEAVRGWPWEDKIMRLGYWRDQTTQLIVHGVRFLPRVVPAPTTLWVPVALPRALLAPDAAGAEPEVGSNVQPEPSDTGGQSVNISPIPEDESSGIRESQQQTEMAPHGPPPQQPLQPPPDRPSNSGEAALAGDVRPQPAPPAGSHKKQGNEQPDVDRIWNTFLQDPYLIIVTLMGAAALVAATVAWANGDIHRSFTFRVSSAITSRVGLHLWNSNGENDLPIFIRGIVFTLLPSLLFGLFNNTFQAADIYNRTMAPIYNMASPLADEDRKRLHPEETDINGATARDSMLLDYISLSFLSCIVSAAGAGHIKIALGLVLATLSNSVYIVVGRIFAFVQQEESTYGVKVQQNNFYAAYAILVVYGVSIWVLRPRGVARTCRRIHTLMDFASLVHKSHILQCPEFWLQAPTDTEEHMRAQVTLADRIYRFGVYTGLDEQDYLGIAIHEVPPAWELSVNTAAHLHNSVEVAKDILRYGLYNGGSHADAFAQEFLDDGPRMSTKLVKVHSNDYSSWRRRAQGLVGRKGRTDTEGGLKHRRGYKSDQKAAMEAVSSPTAQTPAS